MDILEVVRRLRAAGKDDVAATILAAVDEATPAADASEFVPAAEAARILDLSLNTIKRRVATGLLRGYKDSQNGYVYVNARSIEELLRLRDSLRASAALPGAEPPRVPAREPELAGARDRQ